MATRRAHTPRNTRLPALSTVSSSPRLLSSHTFTLIASWRGQLVICTIVLVVGAIYFVVREPIRQWRRRQRERISRALTAELLSMERQDSRGTHGDEKDRPSSSTKCVSTALPTSKKARERGRERRKEAKEAKKRVDQLRVCVSSNGSGSTKVTTPETAGVPTPDCLVASPPLAPVTSTESTDSSTSQVTNDETPARRDLNTASEQRQQPSAAAPLNAPTITLDDATPFDANPYRSPSTQSLADSSREAPLLPPSTLEIDLSTDGENNATEFTTEPSSLLPSRPPSQSTSYSVVPDDGFLPVMNPTKKKRKSKARSICDASRGSSPQVPRPPSLTALRAVSSDDASSSRSVPLSWSAPGSPGVSLRRRQTSVGGMPMTPALDLLLSNHERTIDHLRAEIGHAKAEESKAREDEARAKDELKRARASEDRMRADCERARKIRDRAESENRRMEMEVHHLRTRFDTLYHIYTGVFTRMRELEIGAHAAAVAASHEGPTSASHLPPPSPFMAYPTPVGLQMSYMPFANGQVYSPTIPNTFALQLPISQSPLRRTDGTSSSDLAGPLTPGLGPSSSTPSQLSSPFPPDLPINPSLASGPSSSSAVGVCDSARQQEGLSAIELRRLHIASSVLKKKPLRSESSDSNTTPASDPSSEKTSETEAVAGLGISQLTSVASTFPSVNGRMVTPSKQSSMCSSTTSSDVSSAYPGRQILITPSSAELYHPSDKSTAASPLNMTIRGEEQEVFVREPDSVDEATETVSETPHESCSFEAAKKLEGLDAAGGVFNPEGDGASTDHGHGDYTPMFASLAHTPEQLAEIARMRETAIRDRERRSQRQRSFDTEAHSQSST